MKKWIFLGCLLALLSPAPNSRASTGLGAQVWLEPSMSNAEIDNYFRIMDQQHMHVARLFMMWNFMETQPGTWDFRVFDEAFRAAEKYHVGIVATLMPNFGPTHRGFWYKTQDGAIPKSRRQLEESKTYIQTVVRRYQNHPALSHWMLMNEPGQMPSPDSLAMERFSSFLQNKYADINKLNAAWLTSFGSFGQVQYSPNWAGGGFTWPVSYLDWQNFWNEHLTWYLAQVAAEIRKNDLKTPLHVNPHALLDIPHRYELSKWTGFLESLGASIHPVWHFNDLKRAEYPFGVSTVCGLVGSAAGNKPFWVTELQGGHNLYTGSQPVNPTREEIQAWVWTSLTSGAEKTIFWCLNPRTQGGESGEWALLDYAGQPSHRLEESSRIGQFMEEEAAFLKKAIPIRDAIVVAISRETVFLQERNGKGQNQPARQAKAHLQSVLACLKALCMKGYHPQIQFVDDIDWTQKTGAKRMVLLPHATALTEEQLKSMKTFAELGNTLVFTGLTGIFSETEGIRWNQNTTYEALTGLKVLEVLTQENEGQYPIPYETFRLKVKGISAADKGDHWMHNLGKGTCIVVPAMVDLRHFLHPDEKQYPDLLAAMTKPFQSKGASDWNSDIPGSFCQGLTDGNRTLSVVHLPETQPVRKVRWERKGEKLVKILNGKGKSISGEGVFEVESGTTFVVLTEKSILPGKGK
jgi:beta-galactosidase